VQYVSDAAFAAHGFTEPSLAPVTPGELPAVNHLETVRETLSGLAASTGYHYRFIAGNETGKAVAGAEGTFTTAAAEGAALPDNRAYELVSTGASGEPYLPEYGAGWQEHSILGVDGEFTFEAAVGGERVTYPSEPGESGGVGVSALAGQTLAERTAGGWRARDIIPAITGEGAGNSEPVFQAFSPELSSGIFEEPSSPTPLAVGVTAGCRALDVGTGFAARPTLTALFKANCGVPLFAGESTDGKHFIFQTEGAITPGSVEATEIPEGHGGIHYVGESVGHGCAFGCNLYEAGEGGVTLVNQVEEHGVLHQVPNATLGGATTPPDFSGAVSTDGSRVFWTDTAPEGEGHPVDEVYVLENEPSGPREVPVSGPHSQYETATPDGRYAYYIEADSRLYRFDTETNSSVALTPAGAVAFAVIGTNTTGADGEYLYFVAADENGALPGVPGQPNIYVIHDGVTSLAATASENDTFRIVELGNIPTAAPWAANLGLRQAQVSPDGTHLIFQTAASLTGFENEGAAEVFVYSAAAARVVCASCDAAGTPPPETEEIRGEGRTGKLTVSTQSNTYVHRWMSANGNRVFFDTSQSLVPEDRNGVMDVYEWEREGEGSCPVKTPASPLGGCQYLLSGGQSKTASFFVDADQTGDNAFFVHIGRLGDTEANPGHMEMYDARVDGGFPPSTAGCTGAACQSGSTGAPATTAPASAVFAGEGNYPPVLAKPVVVVTRRQHLAKALAACRRAHLGKRRRIVCERLARRRYGPPAKRARARRASYDLVNTSAKGRKKHD
jgi:hypothetical protein